MLRLRVTPAAGEPFTHAVEAASLTIGRARDADLTLDDRFLSRRHARLFRDGERLLIEDLGSQNGTFVNDERVEGAVELRPGDVVRLSASVLAVEDAAGEERAPGSATALFRPASDILARREAPPAPRADAETLALYAERLRLVNEVHQALARSVGLDELLELILDRVFEHLRPEEAALYLEGPGRELRLAASRPPSGAADERFFSRSLAREVTEKGLAALVVDARTDERFAAADSILLSGVRSIAAAPLLTPEGCQGMITLSSRLQVRQFDEGDLELLVSLASAAALHIRNLALAEEAAERRRLTKELALARRIQVGLLPAALPEVPGWELHGGSVPSQEASGDYYLIARREAAGDCVAMVVDVSGKGIAAALLTASVEALAAGFLELGLPPEEVCDRVCRRLYDRTPPEKYATAFLAVLEPGGGRVRWANAGHNAGLVVRADGAVETLDATGPPLGLVPGARRRGADLVLGPGDLLVLYTDGVTEALDRTEAEYGTERLAALCVRHRSRPLPELARALEDDLARFAGGVPFHDDRTVVLARRS
ncbi:MAG TPA: SpoIIE family protein phosphatase, partial [Thermoanaerobaculia bacterium]